MRPTIVASVIGSSGTGILKRSLDDEASAGHQMDIQCRARRKLMILRDAASLDDLRVPPGTA